MHRPDSSRPGRPIPTLVRATLLIACLLAFALPVVAPALAGGVIAAPTSRHQADPDPSMFPVSIQPAASILLPVDPPTTTASPSPVVLPSLRVGPPDVASPGPLSPDVDPPGPSPSPPRGVPLPSIARPSEFALPDQVDQSASITIRAWRCPVGYDPFVDLSSLAEDCVTPDRGTMFEVRTPGSSWTAIKADINGEVILDVGRGTYEVALDPSERLDASIPVGCGEGAGGAERASVARVELRVTLEPGEHLACDWYAVPAAVDPDDIDASVVIARWDCPAGFDPDAPGATLAVTCDPLDGATFSANAVGQFDRTAVTGSLGITGQAFLRLPAAVWGLTEVSPGGDGPVVSCRSSAIPVGVTGPLEDPVLTDTVSGDVIPSGAVQVTVSDGATVTCDWVVNRVAGATIEVRAWVCPPGTNLLEPGLSAGMTCAAPADDVTFRLTGEGGDLDWARTTGTDQPGIATFLDAPPRENDLTLESGEWPWAAWRCGAGQGQTGTLRLAVPGLAVVVPPPAAGDEITCDWYLVPGG